MGPYHVMRSSADYFRSKCSKKGWRPRKRSRQRFQCKQQVEQDEHEQTDASDPAGTLSTLLVDGPSPDFNANLKQIIDLYNQIDHPWDDWHYWVDWHWDDWHYWSEPDQAWQLPIPIVLAPVEQVPIDVGDTTKELCAQWGCECQSNSSDHLLL